MIALLQRVSSAAVTVDHSVVGSISTGLLVFLGVEKHDSEAELDRLLERVLGYRVFEDAAGKMNLSLLDTKGELLVVSQFTLAADTKRGSRAGFSTAAEPSAAQQLYHLFIEKAQTKVAKVAAGQFGAHMMVSLTNDGPVTFWLQVPPSSTR
jgi:D-aminoacyl-tRNA deacylase